MKRLLLTMIFLLSVAGAAFAQEATPEGEPMPEMTEVPTISVPEAAAAVQLDATTITAPETVPGGVVTIAYTNNAADMPVLPIVLHLNEGVTPEQINETGGNPFMIAELASSYGGPLVNPGATLNVTYNFEAGNYLILNIAGQPPTTAAFTVAESGAAPEATAGDVNVELQDFAFTMPLDITAGEQLWHLVNTGEQMHEIGLMKLDENMTIADYQRLIDAMGGGAEGDTSEFNTEDVFAWVGMTPNQEAWFSLDLQPGTYLAFCYFPDFNTGHTHADLGMVQLITVK